MKRIATFLFCSLALLVAGLSPSPASAVQQSIFCLQVGPGNACGAAVVPTPTPTSTPLAANGPPFSAPSNYPNTAFQPYSHATSNPLNTMAAASASVDASSSTWQSYYNGSTSMFSPVIQFGYTNQVQEYKHPGYFGQAGDPLYTINSGTCPDGYGDCSGSFHAPTYMVAAGGTDHHMFVVDQTTNIERDLYNVTAINNSTHVITAGNADQTNVVTGDGLNGEQTRSGFREWAGAIRQPEFVAAAATGAEIMHALAVTAPCTRQLLIYPSATFGTTDTLCSGGNGAPYGGWLRLNMTEAQIVASAAPNWAKGMMRTLRDWGGFIYDTNGNNGFGLLGEPDIMYSASGYTNASCPTTSPASGIKCSPMTAWEHGSNSDADWTGDRYNLDLGQYISNSAWQWIDNPPGHP